MSEEKKRGFEKRLAAYAAAAAGVMALAPAADAAIQYSGPKNLVLDSASTPISIDLNGDSVIDFVFQYSGYGITHSLSFTVNTTTGTRQWIGFTGNSDAARLNSGYQIRANITAASLGWYVDFDSLDILAAYSDGGTTDGNFNGARGYMGVRFTSATCTGRNGTGFHYGWIQFEATADATQGTVIDWAYEDQCNTPIRAGYTGQVTTVPTLNQWGILALIGLLAGGGMLAMRRRQEA